MRLIGKVAVVTGGASGIGRALCERFAAEGASGVAVVDLHPERAREVAAALARPAGSPAASPAASPTGSPGARPTGSPGGTRAIGIPVDVTDEAALVAMIDRVEAELGPIDLFCSNAGIAVPGGAEVPDRDWERIWAVNVMAHVYAARALVPRMAARGGGYLLNTASAAGLLTNLGSAPYSVTKHAAVALAEWLSITHADDGIKVSCLCPQGVRTPLLLEGLAAGDPAGSSVLASGEMIEPEQVADAVVEALDEERFLVLPHPEVAAYMRHRAEDPDRWLRGMRRLWAQVRRP